ncbi:MAG: hypothetical protein QHJ82_01990, partial [Verrucomicrobiota bacterium]|nr:hypothetical protein [Verrucomicrobiota bacterium]
FPGDGVAGHISQPGTVEGPGVQEPGRCPSGDFVPATPGCEICGLLARKSHRDEGMGESEWVAGEVYGSGHEPCGLRIMDRVLGGSEVGVAKDTSF